MAEGGDGIQLVTLKVDVSTELTGYLALNENGWAKLVQEDRDATQFKQEGDEPEMILKICSGPFADHYLASDWYDGVGAWQASDDAGHWKFEDGKKLVIQNFTSAGHAVSYNQENEFLYTFNEYQVAEVAINSGQKPLEIPVESPQPEEPPAETNAQIEEKPAVILEEKPAAVLEEIPLNASPPCTTPAEKPAEATKAVAAVLPPPLPPSNEVTPAEKTVQTPIVPATVVALQPPTATQPNVELERRAPESAQLLLLNAQREHDLERRAPESPQLLLPNAQREHDPVVGSLQRGNTTEQVEHVMQQRKKTLALGFVQALLGLITLILDIIGIGKDSEACDSSPVSWSQYYTGHAVNMGLIFVCNLCLLQGLYLVQNEAVVRGVIHDRKGADGSAEIAEGAASAAMGMQMIACSACIACLAGLFALIWFIIGIVTYFSNSDKPCSEARSWFWLIVCCCISLSIVSGSLKPKQEAAKE